jgi:hypothetical protein
MAITGVHGLLYTAEAEAVREVLRDVFGWKHVDSGDGWLIFKLPSAEVGVHPLNFEGAAPHHELSLMCDDIEATVAELRGKGLTVGEPSDQGFGVVAQIELPGGLSMMVYEPRHPTAI